MAKFTGNDYLDGGIDKIATASTLLVCVGQPTSRSDALSKAIATIPMTSADFTKGDYANGRKLVVAQKADIDVTANGQADHVALIGNTEGEVYVTTSTPQQLVAGGKVTAPTWTIRFSDPL